MGFVDFLISKLVGYDILKSEKELKVSLGNAQRQISSLMLLQATASEVTMQLSSLVE